MPLKPVLMSLDEVDEALRGLYVEKDGQYVLDVEGVVPQERLREFRDNNIALMKEREELRKQLARFEGVDPEKYAEALKKLEELDDKKMLDEGKIEELLQARTERLRADYDNQIKGYQKKISELEDGYRTVSDELKKERIDGRIREAAIESRFRREALPFVIDRARHVWDLENGEPVALENGQPIYGKDPSKRISMKEWLEDLADHAPFLVEGTTGSGASNTGMTNARLGRTIPRGDPLAFGKNLEDIAAGKASVQ